MNKSELRLMAHDAAWKDDFAAERGRIAARVADSSFSIEHIGSTSIPGVWAKPILDIAMLCGRQGLEPVIKALRELGYEYRGQFEETANGHFYAVLEKDNVRFCQAHIYTEINDDWRIKLKFRDALRENSELAREYNDYKSELAKTVSDKSEYAKIKEKWVDSFILRSLSSVDN